MLFLRQKTGKKDNFQYKKSFCVIRKKQYPYTETAHFSMDVASLIWFLLQDLAAVH